MRVAFLSNLALPSGDTYGEQLVNSLAGLAGAGVRVDLHSPARGRPDLDELLDFYGVPPGADGGRLRWLEVPLPRALRERLPEKAWAELRAAWNVAGGSGQLVMTRHPHAVLHALARGRRVVFETYRMRVGGLRRLLWRHPRMLGAVAHSRLSAEALRRAGLRGDRVMVAHNGIWPSEVAPLRAEPAVAATACYAGHVRADKGIDALLAMADAVPELQLRILGATPGRRDSEDIRGRAASRDNVRVLDRVAPREVPGRLAAADVLVIPPVSAPLQRWGRTVLPMKTFRYLAAARPILAPDLPDLREVLEHGVNAWLVRPDDPSAAADALRRLAGDPHLRAHLAAGAGASARELTWERRGARVRDFLARLQEQR